MGKIQPKTCEGRELTKNQLVALLFMVAPARVGGEMERVVGAQKRAGLHSLPLSNSLPGCPRARIHQSRHS